METKKCKKCGREFPVTDFLPTRWGNYSSVCKKCINDKKAETRNNNRIRVVSRIACPDYSDPDFDGKQPVEVIQLMKRAKMWLEAQGYTITLKGTYTQVREVKF